ncbi:hypothetical protein [uncultured Maricaulis sp.]|uniref:hypothetical protein n=1 Tax=uncultured Maricaulis sp. TaxID=174710 RepID=UPI002611F7BD|nr:hypothetical protein [uncultured Maricaulis sp.]
MKIAIHTFGTRGDVQRCLALALVLRRGNGFAKAADPVERDAERWAGRASAGNAPKSG